MKQIKDNSLYGPEFQKLIDSKQFVNMMIDEDDDGIVIRLEKKHELDTHQKRDRRLQMLEKTAGILKDAPHSVKQEFQTIADRDGEDDREGSQL
jgi:CMP-N-acetylneuraminic acid synthetase